MDGRLLRRRRIEVKFKWNPIRKSGEISKLDTSDNKAQKSCSIKRLGICCRLPFEVLQFHDKGEDLKALKEAAESNNVLTK